MVFETLLNPIFSPLLKLDPLLGIIIISLLISFIITIVYKFVTDQDLMKRLKDEMKALQKEIKELKGHPEKAMKVQKQAMETNMKYMMQSLKPTLFTMLPIIIIFGWLNAHMAFYPILPGQEFTATINFEKGADGTIELIPPEGIEIVGESMKKVEDSKVIFTLKGKVGEYFLEVKKGDRTYTKEVIITSERRYSKVEEPIKESEDIKTIKLGNDPIKPFGKLSIFGWRPGWLGAYILFSILFSSLLRKGMKIY